jgi:DNA-binding transcriptional ArsR family regulator
MPRAVRGRDAAAARARDERVFKSLADATRRRILKVMGEREMRASDVAAAFDVSRPAISRHLRILREAGLVAGRADGRERRYRIVPGPLRDAAAKVRALDAFWAEGFARLREHLDERGR